MLRVHLFARAVTLRIRSQVFVATGNLSDARPRAGATLEAVVSFVDGARTGIVLCRRQKTIRPASTAHGQRVKGPGCTGSNGPANTEPAVAAAVNGIEVVAVGAPEDIGRAVDPRPAPNNAGTTATA